MPENADHVFFWGPRFARERKELEGRLGSSRRKLDRGQQFHHSRHEEAGEKEQERRKMRGTTITISR